MGYEGGEYRGSRGQNYGYRNREGRGGHGARPSGYDYEDRGFFDRAGDEVRSWFGDEEAERRRRWDEREYERRYGHDDDHSRWQSVQDRGYARGGYASGGGGYWSRPAVGYETGGYRDTGYVGSSIENYAPYYGGTYRENTAGGRHDPRYHEWRTRELERLDRDYEDYRREHQRHFDNDFGTWRNTRQGQRQLLNNVREHQEVVGSDGEHVGTVDHVRADRILLTKTDQNAGGRHHSIPCGWIKSVSDKVELNRTASNAQQAWKDEERRGALGEWDDDNPNGPHILNRSFAGTY